MEEVMEVTKLTEVFKIAEFDTEGSLKLHQRNFITYNEALEFIKTNGIIGKSYQVQKVFVLVHTPP